MSSQTVTNLESLILQEAAAIAEQMNQIAAWANSEEDVRHECNKLIDAFLKKAGIQAKGRHEYSIGAGRLDSKYQGVLLEYKHSKGPGRITEDSNAAGTKKAVEQLKQRFRDFENEQKYRPERLFGVGCDGDTVVFVRYRNGKWDVDDPRPVTRYSVERLLRALVSLGAQGYSFTPEHLAAHFGADSPVAQKGIRDLYQAITETDSKKAKTFFAQWKILFGEVCGYDLGEKNEKIKELGDHYAVAETRPAELLFAIHSYYAIFIKFLAAEIVSSFSPLGVSTLKKCVGASTPAKLKREMEALEQGGIWSQLGITNFLEGDLFSWYLAAWDTRVADIVWGMVKRLDEYDPATLSVEPAESRDLIKKLYQHLFPKSVRHDLGEYYTPDWLAEHVLNELGYEGDPGKRLLDPACGSGTFLVTAINRIKLWFGEHRHECGYDETELLQKILKNVIGFDLNPLAVMAARTNYLLAIRDLLKFASSIELPVYLCDSIMTPAQAGSHEAQISFLTETGVQYDPSNPPMAVKTAPAVFLVPREIASTRQRIGKYADVLEFCVRNKYNTDDFIARCKEEGLPITDDNLHRGLYRTLRKLDADNQNGIWARIIKNAFAPLFTEPVDYVAGNPPWIRWVDLPKVYRDQTKPLWTKYGLFTQKGLSARMGTAELDFSMLFLYACTDFFLTEDAGKIGFLITQECIRSKKAGEGFRRFCLGEHGRPFRVLVFHDFSEFQPFEASNKTAAIICSAIGRTEYPVAYVRWTSRVSNETLRSFPDWENARRVLERKNLVAIPVDSASGPWQVSEPGHRKLHQKLRGQCSYKARRGADLEPYGVYFVRLLERLPNGMYVVENQPDLGKKTIEKLPPQALEEEFLFPSLRGGDIDRWSARPRFCVVVANRSTRGNDVPSEEDLRRHFPKTYEYFSHFRSVLLGRGSNIARSLAEKTSFFAAFGVGEYTWAPVKVVWQRMASAMKAVVVTTFNPFLDGRPMVPTATTSYVPFPEAALQEAHYLCAVLNSVPARFFFASYSSAGRGFGSPSLIDELKVPTYQNAGKYAGLLASLSERCHRSAADNDMGRVSTLEGEINDVAAVLWDLTREELKSIKDSLKESEAGKWKSSEHKGSAGT